MNPLESQKIIINASLAAAGKEQLSPEAGEKLCRDLNKKLAVAEVVTLLVAAGVYFAGGGLAGSLLGYSFGSSGAAVLILRTIMSFDLRNESRKLKLSLASKTIENAVKNARVARSNPTTFNDLFGPKA